MLPNVTSEIKFINKGSHPRYGERLSSVTEITSKTNINNITNVEIGLNGVSADAIIEIPVVKDKLNIQASLRHSYTTILETTTFNQLAHKVFEGTKINENGDNDFSFFDYNFKLNYKPNSINSFYVSTISIDNRLDYISNEPENDRTFNDILKIKNTGYGIGWYKKWSTNVEHQVKAFFSDYKFNYNFITNAANEQLSDFEKRNTILDSGVSVEFNYTPSKSFNYTFGYQYVLKDVAYASYPAL